MSSANPPDDDVDDSKPIPLNDVDDREPLVSLLANIKAAMPQLRQLWRDCDDHWGFEDPVYRFYHQSWKVYHLQGRTTAIVAALQALAPDRDLNEWFMQIVRDGTGKRFEGDHNKRWLEVTRPILEAFFHAKYFLGMAIRYGKLEKPPRSLPSGWAGLLYLYNLRYDGSPEVLEAMKRARAARRKFPPHPDSIAGWPPVTNEDFVRHLAAIGYSGLANVEPHPHPENPAAVLLWGLTAKTLEPRLVEGLPWILLAFSNLDMLWVGQQAQLRNLQNRLGFLVHLAYEVARPDPRVAHRTPILAALLKSIEPSRLAREEALFEAPNEHECDRIRALRGSEAAHWNLFTLLKPEHLRYTDIPSLSALGR
jgi:hypothetical protein